MTRRRLDGRIAVVASSGKGVGGAVAGRLAADGAAVAPGPIAVWEKGNRPDTYMPELWETRDARRHLAGGDPIGCRIAGVSGASFVTGASLIADSDFLITH
jgi:hypothetical protein